MAQLATEIRGPRWTIASIRLSRGTRAEVGADVERAGEADHGDAHDVERHAGDAAVQVRREIEAVEEIERRADDECVHQGAKARALPECGREDEHRERHDHDGRAEAPARVIRDRLVEDVPGAQSDIGAHRQQLAPAVEQQCGDERDEARARAPS